VAGCNHTSGTVQSAQAKTAGVDCEEAAQKAMEAQTNAAVLGSALSVAGGIGGFGGRGGAILGSAASIGSTVVQAQAGSQSRSAMAECNA